MTLAVDMGMTQTEFDALELEYRKRRVRVEKRRVHNHVPKGWAVHKLELFNLTSHVFKTVDECTSGQWAYINMKEGGMNAQRYDVIAFEDPKDLTMFLMSYEPSDPIRRGL